MRVNLSLCRLFSLSLFVPLTLHLSMPCLYSFCSSYISLSLSLPVSQLCYFLLVCQNGLAFCKLFICMCLCLLYKIFFSCFHFSLSLFLSLSLSGSYAHNLTPTQKFKYNATKSWERERERVCVCVWGGCVCVSWMRVKRAKMIEKKRDYKVEKRITNFFQVFLCKFFFS